MDGAKKNDCWPAGRWSIMDDSQANNDNRMERPKNRAQEQAQRKQEEYDDLIRLLKERVEEMNANTGNLPKFVVRGSTIQLDHIVLHLEFDELFMSPADYVLVLKVGLASFKRPLFGSEPPPVKHKLQPAASDNLSSI